MYESILLLAYALCVWGGSNMAGGNHQERTAELVGELTRCSAALHESDAVAVWKYVQRSFFLSSVSWLSLSLWLVVCISCFYLLILSFRR